jgi:hypothetical protein
VEGKLGASFNRGIAAGFTLGRIGVIVSTGQAVQRESAAVNPC